MKLLYVILGALICCHLATANSVGDLEGYSRVNPKGLADYDDIIEGGTHAALNLAVADNALDAHTAARYHVESVGRVARKAKSDENATSYFVVVRVSDAHYPDVKAVVGYVIDKDNTSGVLTLRAYKLGSA